MTVTASIHQYTERLKQKGLLRTRAIIKQDAEVFVRFDSNDYLSLTQDRQIAQAYQEGYKRYPSGSGGSMLLSGYHENHRAVERVFSDFLAVDDCVLFSSGYAANLAIASLLGQVKAPCLIDKGVHASIYDGLALAKVNYKRYHHNNLNHLEKQLCSNRSQALITEGIFSMSGQIAPLSTISTLCRTKQIDLLVDEAHSIGVLGNSGQGAVAFHQLSQEEVPLRTIPLGKAFAAQGALVAGKKEWLEALLQAGRSLIYSTSISPALSYGLLKTVDRVIAADDRRNKLNSLIQQFKQCIKQSPLIWSNSNTAIQQLQLGCPQRALEYAELLKAQHIICSVIRAPTVPTKATGLRIILNYHHTAEQIVNLFTSLSRIYENKPH